MSLTWLVGGLERLRLLGRGHDVPQADRHAAAGRELEADVLDAVDEVGRVGRAEQPVALVDEALEVRPAHLAVGQLGEPEPIGNDLVEDDPADGRPDPLRAQLAGLLVPGR